MQSKASDTSSLIKMAQSAAQGLNAASVGHVNDLTIEWFQKLTGTMLIRVPYKGDSAVINDLVANRIDLAFLAPNVAMPLAEGKKINALAITSKGKVGALGALPTIQDAGISGFEVEIWNGLLAPAGTSPAIVNRLNAALKVALQAPELQAKLALSGQHVIIDSPTEFREKIDREGKQWKAIAKEANLPLLEQ